LAIRLLVVDNIGKHRVGIFEPVVIVLAVDGAARNEEVMNVLTMGGFTVDGVAV
jgi:hypothetical protein